MTLVALGSLMLASAVAFSNAKADSAKGQESEYCDWCPDETKAPKAPKNPKTPKESKPPAPEAPPEAPAPPPSPPQAPAPPPPPAAPPPTPPIAKQLPPTPRVVVRKSGPGRAVATGRARFYVRVNNFGDAPARGVAITDILPSGFFIHAVEVEATARKNLKWKRVKPRIRGGRLVLRLGTLRPGEMRKTRITVRLGRAVRGRKCNIARASVINAGAVSVARNCVRVIPPRRTKTPPAVTG